MKKMIFYDSKRSEVMVWTNVEFQSSTLLLNLSLTYSIYKAGLSIVVEMERIKLLKDALVTLTDLKKKPECHEVALAENFDIALASDGYGGIDVALVLNDKLNVDLTINYQIDQSFLPEMIQLMESLLQNTITLFLEKNQESIVICRNSALRLQNVIVCHEDASNEPYLRMKLGVVQCYVNVELDMYMYVDEFILFREELDLLRNNEVQQVKLAPLGEFVVIELYRNEKGLCMKGEISDSLMPQSCLSFRNDFDNLAFQQLFEDVSLVSL